MFHVLELNAKLLPDLKEIAKKLGVKVEGIKKQDLILQIIEAQSSNTDVAAKLKQEYMKSESGETTKRPRKVKLDPISEEVSETKLENNDLFTEEISIPEEVEVKAEESVHSSGDEKKEESIGSSEPVMQETTENNSHEPQHAYEKGNIRHDFKNKHRQREEIHYNFDGIVQAEGGWLRLPAFIGLQLPQFSG